mmetsp:Transcript_76133/g.196127  ORF Transcript_76133/g.196127 Transcript_76133/m.196127 type:complete len:264 (+) Transcript_76133:33-824(+)
MNSASAAGSADPPIADGRAVPRARCAQLGNRLIGCAAREAVAARNVVEDRQVQAPPLGPSLEAALIVEFAFQRPRSVFAWVDLIREYQGLPHAREAVVYQIRRIPRGKAQLRAGRGGDVVVGVHGHLRVALQCRQRERCQHEGAIVAHQLRAVDRVRVHPRARLRDRRARAGRPPVLRALRVARAVGHQVRCRLVEAVLLPEERNLLRLRLRKRLHIQRVADVELDAGVAQVRALAVRVPARSAAAPDGDRVVEEPARDAGLP